MDLKMILFITLIIILFIIPLLAFIIKSAVKIKIFLINVPLIKLLKSDYIEYDTLISLVTYSKRMPENSQ